MQVLLIYKSKTGIKKHLYASIFICYTNKAQAYIQTTHPQLGRINISQKKPVSEGKTTRTHSSLEPPSCCEMFLHNVVAELLEQRGYKVSCVRLSKTACGGRERIFVRKEIHFERFSLSLFNLKRLWFDIRKGQSFRYA